MKWLAIICRLIEALIVLSLVIATAKAIRTPCPMMETGEAGHLVITSGDSMAYKVFTLPADRGGLRFEVEPAPGEPGIDPLVPNVKRPTWLPPSEAELHPIHSERSRCVRVLNHGVLVQRACDEEMTCWFTPTGPFLEVHELPGERFNVGIVSSCDSGCCDLRGMIIDKHGHRLDDGPWDRFYTRAGWFGYAGLIIAAIYAVIRAVLLIVPFRHPALSAALSAWSSIWMLPALYALLKYM